VNHSLKSVLWGIIAVLTFDTLASLAARAYSFPYARSNLAANILFLGIGFFTARSSVTHPVRTAALAGAIVGAVDALAGPPIRSAVGITPAAGITLSLHWEISLALSVIALSTFVATLGGLLGRRQRQVSGP
jgi:hypothetical protein